MIAIGYWIRVLRGVGGLLGLSCLCPSAAARADPPAADSGKLEPAPARQRSSKPSAAGDTGANTEGANERARAEVDVDDPSTASDTGEFGRPNDDARDDNDEPRDNRTELSGRDKTRLSALSPETVTGLLARYTGEPSVREVVQAALHASATDPQRYTSMLRRARWRGVLPSLALGARRGQGIDLRSTIAEDDSIRFTSGDDLVLSATVRFELGRLLFADEEVSITREARAGHAARLELARNIVHWYFVRRRLQLERDALGYTSITRELHIVEIESLLDTFTNGAWGRMIGRRRSAWTTDESTRVFEPP